MSNQVKIYSPLRSPQEAEDLHLLRTLIAKISNSDVKEAVMALVAGLESEGVVVGKVNDLLTPQQAADFLGLSRQYVDKLITTKRIRVQYKPSSKHRLLKLSDIVALERNRQERSAKIGNTVNELIEAGAQY